MTEVPSQPQPQVTPSPKPHNWKKVALTVLFIVGIVAVIVGIYWFMVVNKSSEDSDLTGPVPEVTTKTATEPAKDATPSAERMNKTAGWNTFNDGKFKIKYPRDWVIEDVSPSKQFHQIHAKTVDEKIIVMFATNFQGGPDFGPDSKLLAKHTVMVNGKKFEANERVRNDDGRWYLVGGGQELYFEGFSKTTPTDKEIELIKAVFQNFELI